MATQQIDYAAFLPPSNNKGKKYHCVSHKRLIAKTCVEALESAQLNLAQKIKAAGILERMVRERDLAARRKLKSKLRTMTKSVTVRQFPSLEQ